MNAKKINLEEMANAIAATVQPSAHRAPAAEATTAPDASPGSTAPDAAKVRQARKAVGLPQVSFARLINTPIALLNDWEQGRQPPPGAALRLFELLIKQPDLIREFDQGTAE